MKEQLEQIKAKALADLAAAADMPALDAVRVRVLGKKGELTAVLKQMGKLSAEERPVMGQMANAVRAKLEEALEKRRAALDAAALEAKLEAEAVDVTIPGKPVEMGHQHPMNRVLQEVKEIFIGMGYQIVDGPEIEEAAYNFTKLNIEEGHPSRDRSDTFYFDDDDSVLLRTQTSPMQIRVMEQQKPPIRMLAPGRVFRKDEADATHSPMFHQVEGLLVDKHVTMADLRGTLTAFMREVFGSDTRIRFRPSFFPFTEPSAEADISCCMCGGKGHVNGTTCRVCKGTGWLEILGCGMVDPEVFKAVGYDPEEVTGFAFGLGVERIAMLKYGIGDLRMFFENDVRFLGQFA